MRGWLIQARKDKGLTQEQVASQCFIDRSYYAQIEKGTRNPSMEVAKQISTALGVNPSAFFDVQNKEPTFLTLLKNSKMIIAYCNEDLEYTWIFDPSSEFNTEQYLGKRDDELGHQNGSVELMNLKREVLDSGRKLSRKITFQLSEGKRTFDIYAEPITDKRGKIIGVITVSLDITKGSQRKNLLKEDMK